MGSGGLVSGKDRSTKDSGNWILEKSLNLICGCCVYALEDRCVCMCVLCAHAYMRNRKNAVCL